MLDEFLIANRGELLGRLRAKLGARDVPAAKSSVPAQGLPLFLDHLITVLRLVRRGNDVSPDCVSSSAAQYGSDLFGLGLPIGQVVQNYGSMCQSVMELASEHNLSIAAHEYHRFNRCLDEAVAQAVTAYEHQRDRMVIGTGAAHVAVLAHEMRNLLTSSMLTFDLLSTGTVGIQGTAGAQHGLTLRRMRALIDRALTEVRLGADIQNIEPVSVVALIEEVQIVAAIEAQQDDIRLSIDAGPDEVMVQGDHQILASVIANLVQNALKFTRPGGHISVRTHTRDERVLVEVQDECGGLPDGETDGLFRPFEQRGSDRTGLGLGLSISRRAVLACGGDLRAQDNPGFGCTFTIDLPRARPTT